MSSFSFPRLFPSWFSKPPLSVDNVMDQSKQLAGDTKLDLMPETMIKLFCWIFGDPNTFPVKISPDETVGDLKKAIVTEKPNRLQGIDAVSLRLWKKEISNEEKDGLQLSDLNDNDELNEMHKVGYYFGYTPPEMKIHIVVRTPESTEAPKRQTIQQAFPRGLEYRSPQKGTLLATSGASWQYQPSVNLRRKLRQTVTSHYWAYRNADKNKSDDKKTVPLYLFFSGSGTGKSRNARELHHLALRCFNGEFGEKVDEIASCLTSPYVFHVSLENGTSLTGNETSWEGIGTRMLCQLVRKDDGKLMSIAELNKLFIPPTPEEVIFCLEQGTLDTLRGKAFILVVDGLRMLNQGIVNGSPRRDLDDIVTRLGNLAHAFLYSYGGFFIVCGTSTISGGAVSKALKASQRWRVYLPCEPIDRPKDANGNNVFTYGNMLEDFLIRDCGGHGRALEILAYYIDNIQKNPSDISQFIDRLLDIYPNAVPNESNSMAIIKSVIGNSYVNRDNILPGGDKTPDEVCAVGLVRFKVLDPQEDNPRGRLEIPYIWILCFCSKNTHPLIANLQLLDYNQISCIDRLTIPGNVAFDSFEKIILQFRKLKSLVFEEGEDVTIGRVHDGALMTDSTANISFRNHWLQDDVATSQTSTKTNTSNEREWLVNTKANGDINLREHRFILLNAANAKAGDIVLCLDSQSPSTEAHQLKYYAAKGGSKIEFDSERSKAVSQHDVFVLITTADSIPFGVQVPDRCVLVCGENWNKYFGPYAARSYLWAKRVHRS